MMEGGKRIIVTTIKILFLTPPPNVLFSNIIYANVEGSKMATFTSIKYQWESVFLLRLL